MLSDEACRMTSPAQAVHDGTSVWHLPCVWVEQAVLTHQVVVSACVSANLLDHSKLELCSQQTGHAAANHAQAGNNELWTLRADGRPGARVAGEDGLGAQHGHHNDGLRQAGQAPGSHERPAVQLISLHAMHAPASGGEHISRRAGVRGQLLATAVRAGALAAGKDESGPPVVHYDTIGQQSAPHTRASKQGMLNDRACTQAVLDAAQPC